MPRTRLSVAAMALLWACEPAPPTGSAGVPDGSVDLGPPDLAPPDLCPNLPDVQTQVPAGLVRNKAGDCVTPPVVTGLSPGSGDYGALVTLTGTDLGSRVQTGATSLVIRCQDAQRNAFTFTAPDTGADAATLRNSVVQDWTDTRITVRYPFPCTGPLTVENPNGESTAPAAFTPSWRPGDPLVYGANESLVSSAALPGGRVALAIQDTGANKLRIAVGGKGAWKELIIPALPAGIRYVTLFADATGQPEGFFLDGKDPPETYYFKTQGDGIQATPTGIRTVSSALGFIAGGRDASGPYVWIRESATEVARYRGSPGWSRERGPFAIPSVYPFGFAATSDGSVLVSWTKRVSEFIFLSKFVAQYAWLTPTGTAFGSTLEGESWGSNDPQRECMVRAPSGQRIRSYGCPARFNPPSTAAYAPRIVTPTGLETYASDPSDATALCSKAYAPVTGGMAAAFCTNPDGAPVLAASLASTTRVRPKLWGLAASYLFASDDATLTLVSAHKTPAGQTVLYAPAVAQ